MVVSKQIPRARYMASVGLVCMLVVLGGGCTQEPAEPTATPYFAAELDWPPPNQSTILTVEPMPDYRRDLTLLQAAVRLKWEPLTPSPARYQLTTGLVDVISYPREGEVLIARYSTPAGVDFELRQAHHAFRSIPIRPTDYDHQDVGNFLLDEWANQYQSFAG